MDSEELAEQEAEAKRRDADASIIFGFGLASSKGADEKKKEESFDGYISEGVDIEEAAEEMDKQMPSDDQQDVQASTVITHDVSRTQR